jgi:hypothetical protein
MTIGIKSDLIYSYLHIILFSLAGCASHLHKFTEFVGMLMLIYNVLYLHSLIMVEFQLFSTANP